MKRRDAEEGPENPAQRQEKLLIAAVGILFGYNKDDVLDGCKVDAIELQRRFGMELVAQTEREVQEIADIYRRQSVSHQKSVKFKDAIEEIRSVETALKAVEAAFDNLSPDAHNMLLGLGPMGTQFTTWTQSPQAKEAFDPEIDLATVIRTTNRYTLPDCPGPSAGNMLRDNHRLAKARTEELAKLRQQLRLQQDIVNLNSSSRGDDILARTNKRIDRLEKALNNEPIAWPEAIAALGMRIGSVWRDYEARFFQKLFQLERELEYGADNSLVPARQPSAKHAKKLDRLSGPPSRMVDGGRNANVFELMYGIPENNFVNACYECFSRYNHKYDISTTKDGQFGSFVEVAFMYAIDAYEIPNENKGAGSGSAGLDHRIRNAVSIQEQLIELSMRTGKLSKEENQKLHSLRLAQVRGSDDKPIWMSRRPRTRKNNGGEGP